MTSNRPEVANGSLLLESVFSTREHAFRLKPIHEIGAQMYDGPSKDLLMQYAQGNSVQHG